jgi:hypothetical protein
MYYCIIGNTCRIMKNRDMIEDTLYNEHAGLRLSEGDDMAWKDSFLNKEGKSFVEELENQLEEEQDEDSDTSADDVSDDDAEGGGDDCEQLSRYEENEDAVALINEEVGEQAGYVKNRERSHADTYEHAQEVGARINQEYLDKESLKQSRKIREERDIEEGRARSNPENRRLSSTLRQKIKEKDAHQKHDTTVRRLAAERSGKQRRQKAQATMDTARPVRTILSGTTLADISTSAFYVNAATAPMVALPSLGAAQKAGGIVASQAARHSSSATPSQGLSPELALRHITQTATAATAVVPTIASTATKVVTLHDKTARTTTHTKQHAVTMKQDNASGAKAAAPSQAQPNIQRPSVVPTTPPPILNRRPDPVTQRPVVVPRTPVEERPRSAFTFDRQSSSFATREEGPPRTMLEGASAKVVRDVNRGGGMEL